MGLLINWPYPALFIKYGDLLVRNRKFFSPSFLLFSSLGWL